MVYIPHTRLVLSGDTFGGAEIFSTSFALVDPTGAPGSAPSGAQRDAVALLIGAWFNDAATGIDSRCTLRSISWQSIAATGAVQPPTFVTLMDDSGGVPQSAPQAAQVALVASLLTDTPGPRGRGRMYLPQPGLQLQSNGLITEGEALSVSGRTAQLFTDINDALDGLLSDLVVGVASSFGVVSPVTTVGVGRVYDTMRSRRNALPDLRYTAPVT